MSHFQITGVVVSARPKTTKAMAATAVSFVSRRWKATVVSGIGKQHEANPDDGSVVAKEQQSKQQQQPPKLEIVPKLPLIGSCWQSYSRLPIPYDVRTAFDFWPAMRQQYGTFYEFGLPGLGVGLTGTLYVIQDPYEMASILRKEGEFPRGVAEFAWATNKWSRDRNQVTAGRAFSMHGPSWKRVRRFVQSDLLSPTSAARYVPAILEAAQVASRGAPQYDGDKNNNVDDDDDTMNQYLNLASFAMFSNATMGYIPKVGNTTESHNHHDDDPKDVEFCQNVSDALRLNSQLMLSGWENIMNQTFGITTRKYQEFDQKWTAALDYTGQKIKNLYQRRLDGTLTEKEQNCYCNVAYDRYEAQQQQQQDVTLKKKKEEKEEERFTLDEVEAIMGGLLAAGVDTTGGMLSFRLLHLASSPEIQDKLYHALQPTLDVHGQLTRESLDLPYLHQILRESHRMGSSVITAPIKTLQTGMVVHGHLLPKGSVVMLETYSTGQQQEHFEDDVAKFVPERFAKEAVTARKGTQHEVVDHVFFQGPFSQGARKCPGSRVANLEAHALMAQWVLDWKMELPSHITHFSQVPYGLRTVITATLPAIQFTPRS